MKSRIRQMMFGVALATAVGLGCSMTVQQPGTTEDGTVEAKTDASALVTGHVDASVSGDVRVFVNDSSRKVVVSPDRSFVVRDVPSGHVTFACEANGVRGSVDIDDVKPGELIDVSVRVEGTIVITITRRDVPSEPPREVSVTSGAPLEIRANNVCMLFPAGNVSRDVRVLGNNVKLVGAGGCGDSEHTVLSGSLEIRGNNAIVEDIELTGNVTVTGNNTRIADTCTSCFDESCYPGHGDRHDDGDCAKKGTCVDAGGGPALDAGSPAMPDAADAGSDGAAL